MIALLFSILALLFAPAHAQANGHASVKHPGTEAGPTVTVTSTDQNGVVTKDTVTCTVYTGSGAPPPPPVGPGAEPYCN